jgi:hypothetical protein
MNAQVMESKATSAEIASVVVETPPEQRFDDLTKRLERVQSDELRSLLDKQNELIGRLNELADIGDVAMAERQRAIIEANLETTREEIAKRTANVGVMAAELMALYDELGLQAQRADEESPDDIAKRKRAKSGVQAAMTAIATAEAAVTTAEQNVTEAEAGWWPFGKEAKVADAKAAVETAKAAVETAKAKLPEAEQAALQVEAQIEIDKADRIRRASLAENFAMIREFTGNAVKVLSEDIEQTETRRKVTEGALNSALTKKAETARSLDALRDEIGTLNRDFGREQRALDEIVDQGSEAYANQQKDVALLGQQLTEKNGTELKLNTLLMSLTAAIEANKSSLAGLTVQRDTAEVYVIKLETAEKTAAVLGHNIDRMIKNTTQETASDALDRANDKMTMGAIEMGIQAEVASAKARNDALDRHKALMQRMHGARDAGDQAMATEAARYVKLDAEVRAGYAAQGIDLDMSHLQAAAEAFSKREAPAPADATTVSY